MIKQQINHIHHLDVFHPSSEQRHGVASFSFDTRALIGALDRYIVDNPFDIAHLADRGDAPYPLVTQPVLIPAEADPEAVRWDEYEDVPPQI